MKTSGLPYTVYINRKLGVIIANATPEFVTPNGLSFFGFLVFIVGLFLLVQSSTHVDSILVVIIFLFQYAIDSADGVLARKRKVSSDIGEWLDHSLDGIRIPLLHIAVLIFFFKSDGYINIVELSAFSLSIIAMSGNYISNILKVKILSVRSGSYVEKMVGMRRIGIKLMLIPADFGIYYFIFLLLAFDFFVYFYLIWGVYFLLIFLMNYTLTYMKKL